MAKHEATCATPCKVMLPFHAGSPLFHQHRTEDLPLGYLHQRWYLQVMGECLLKLFDSHEVPTRRYNQGRIPHPFKSGDLSFLQEQHSFNDAGCKICAKLSCWWHKPLCNETFLTPVTVQIVHPKSGSFFTQAHLSLLKPVMLGEYYSGKVPSFKDYRFGPTCYWAYICEPKPCLVSSFGPYACAAGACLILFPIIYIFNF
jgi:hypothetical protein